MKACLKLTGINLLAFGLELCASAGFTYIPPIMLKNGFTDKSVTVILGIGPFISLIVVPIIGYWSDRCQSPFGRRRPFMLALGIIMIVSLLIIPFSHDIFNYYNVINPSFVLASGVILLDFSSQALMNPCKALISDLFHTLEEQSCGFTVYSCMLSLGGCLGYFITSLNWTTTILGRFFGSQEKAVFSLLAILLLFLLIANLSVAQEKPLEKRKPLFFSGVSLDKNCNDFALLRNIDFDMELENKLTCSNAVPKIFSFPSEIPLQNMEKNYCCKLFKSFHPKFSFLSSNHVTNKYISSWSFQVIALLKNSFREFFTMPPVLLHLFIASLFGWMGIMCHDMYYTDFVGQVIYQGKPQAEKESLAFNLYDEGVRMGSWGLLLHCLFAALYAAFVQEKLISQFGKKRTYLLGMTIFSLSLLGTIVSNYLLLVNIFSALSGLGLAAITTVPYSLISEYYSKKEIYYNNNRSRGVGEDMAVLDSAVYLSQIIPSVFLGYIVERTGTSATYMIVAALCGVTACYLSKNVTFTS